MTGPDPFESTDGSAAPDLAEAVDLVPPVERVQPRLPYPVESGPGSGRMLAVILLIAIAFGAGIAVDQAAFRASETAAVPTAAPLPTPAVRPSTSSRPGATPAPRSSGPRATDAGPGATVSPTPALTPGPTIGPGASVAPYAPANVGLIWDAIKTIQEHFVRRGQLNPTDLTYGMLNGLVDSLGDPGHTVFLTPDEVKSENDSLNGKVSGIGIYLGVEGGAPFIQSVISGSPASRAGLLAGDRIIGINGSSAENLSQEELARLIRGPEGTKVTMTVIHAHSDSPLTVTITRATITVPAVTWAMLPGTMLADIRINEFSANANDEFISALRGARQAGARGIVLDLRGNPGGYVDEAVGVASQLVGSGTVYIRRTADGEQIPVKVKPGGIATELPLVVLIDYGTASSAEITAGAIQAANRATLVGIRTYGTGTVLNTFNLADGSAIRLGVEEWLTPDGKAIFPNGIQPDQVVDLAGDTQPLEPDTLRSMTADDLQSSGDDQLLRAIADLSGR